MSRFEPLRTLGDHSECGSDCSMREGNNWGDMVSSGNLSKRRIEPLSDSLDSMPQSCVRIACRKQACGTSHYT